MMNRIKKYSKLKIKIPLNMHSNVAYKFSCKECSKCYVGQTERYLTNMSEHGKDTKKLINFNPTALVEYLQENWKQTPIFWTFSLI